MGESAGGTSVGILLSSPAARPGLFSRAYLQSPALAVYQRTLPEMKEFSYEFAKNVSCAAPGAGVKKVDLKCLRALPIKDILHHVIETPNQDAHKPLKPFSRLFDWWPHLDGVISTKPVLELLRNGESKKVPVLIGTNRDETAVFTTLANFFFAKIISARDMFQQAIYEASLKAAFGDKVPTVKQHYPSYDTWEKNQDIYTDLTTDYHFSCPCVQAAEGLSKKGIEVYSYEITKVPLYLGGFAGPCQSNKVCHVFDVPLMWRPRMLPLREETAKFSDSIIAYLMGFVAGDINKFSKDKSHVPKEGPVWPKFQVVNNKPGSYMDLGETLQVKTEMRGGRCNLWNNDLGYGF